MDRFSVTTTARFPGKVRDLWTDFTFYCFTPEEVVEHLNKILQDKKEEEEEER
ncbi:hypothetical protein LCGC14_0739490 [marine sediment metagenome]|uniref:Uncharacterized protein n=1 Tax=marine sediment metagenome TaxID=412755 RepID=A0A0F9QS80_9ZZZZ